MRAANVHGLLDKAMHTRKDVPDKDLQGAIAEWDRGIEVYQKSTGKAGVDPDQHRMLLTQMCSAELRKKAANAQAVHPRYRGDAPGDR